MSQIRRLRKLALIAIQNYPIRVKSLCFLRHGENTIFRVEDQNRNHYTLRIHRNDYHSPRALISELKFLNHLARKNIPVPIPVPTKERKLITAVAHQNIPTPRNCSLLKWMDGQFLRKPIKPEHLYQIGLLIGKIQAFTPKTFGKSRCYWTATGLVGEPSRFGTIDSLKSATPKQQAVITAARKKLLPKLLAYEKKFPNKLGRIHSDLHFGNLLVSGGEFIPIDFDDCGYGFFVYDLVAPLLSVESIEKIKDATALAKYRSALIDGYSTVRPWDQHDSRIFNDLVSARQILMLAWLNSRSDNPRLRSYLKKTTKEVVHHVQRQCLELSG